MAEPITILFAGGGTGGHLYPGIAVAEALREVAPQARPLFLCTKREIDRVILEPTGFEFITQPVIPLALSISGMLRFSKKWWDTKDLVRGVLNERKPAAVLGLGGYAATPAVREASARKIPGAILNPDVIPGKANQLLMKRVQAVCCQFDETAGYVKEANRGKLKTTGCPIRNDIRNLPPREQAAQRLKIDPHLNTLVVTGASLGAQTVNEAVLTMLETLSPTGWQILHLSGRDHADAVRAGYKALTDNGRPVTAQVIDFTPAMADIWSVADLAICRSGASSCAELTACGVPSLLMPYPFHKDMHQRLNAKVLADGSAAILIDDEKDRKKNAPKLTTAIAPLLQDANKRRQMADAARKLGKSDAAERVAKLVIELARASF
jgi:UDP-N-acetylglucosamine--N-acetylmuramyl-(pentapeptide) pyrophosphoryl-undecaprenol N-acetylglucosamine transferase